MLRKSISNGSSSETFFVSSYASNSASIAVKLFFSLVSSLVIGESADFSIEALNGLNFSKHNKVMLHTINTRRLIPIYLFFNINSCPCFEDVYFMSIGRN